MASSCVIVPIEDLGLTISCTPRRKSLLPVPDDTSPLDQLCRSIAMEKLAKALEDETTAKMSVYSKHGDIILSKLTRVPRMSRTQLRKLIDAGKVSPFTVEVLDFVNNYRGTNVANFLNNLHIHMKLNVHDHEFISSRGTWYKASSIHTLIKKALIYTKL